MKAEISQGDRLMTHKELDKAVEDLAHAFGYKMSHFRPAMTERGWRTPVSADGHGWPDYVLAKEGMPLIIAEGKTEGDRLTKGYWKGEGRKAHFVMGQSEWFELLGRVPGIRCLVVHPHDLNRIANILQGKE